MTRHFLVDTDVTAAEQRSILTLAADMKKSPAKYDERLRRRTIGLLFHKPSTRTRLSFQVAAVQLGGAAVVLDPGSMQVTRGESVEDTAGVLSRYLDALVIRTFGQEILEQYARASTIPVVNALTDAYHPCQALADLQTMEERFGKLAGLTLAYVGDGNNVSHSLLLAGALAGVNVVVCTPASLQPDPKVVEAARRVAQAGARITISADLASLNGVHAVYTDTWVSMGQEGPQEKDKKQTLAPYRVNPELMRRAAANAIFLHCLPAHRGDEVVPEVIDGPQSAIFDQAENRLHAQKALLAHLLAR